MNCRHDWQRADTKLDVQFVLDQWQGPTDAVVRCGVCGEVALLRLLHWSGRNLCTRIYALASIDSAAFAVFVRNMRSASCDLSRHGAEVQALMATAAPVSEGLIVLVPEMQVLATLDLGEIGKIAIKSWRDIAPVENDPRWLAILSRHHLNDGI